MAAAGDLFRAHGVAETTMEQIAERAGLSPATLYNYFESKAALLLALVALDGAQVRQAGARLVADPPADPTGAVCELLCGYVDHCLLHLDKRMWRHMIGTALIAADTSLGAGYRRLDRRLAAQVAALCAALQRRGDLAHDVGCRDAGGLLFGVCNTVFTDFIADDTMSLAAMKRRMVRDLRLAMRGWVGAGA